MPRPIVVDDMKLSRTLLAPARGATCRLDVCGGGCCGGGIWVDILHVQAILAAESDIAPLLGPERRDPDGWFSDETMDHADFASGVGTATRVLPRPDGSGRHGCTFLMPDNCCALQRASEIRGMAWPGLKPIDCATFPILRSEGHVVWDRQTARAIPGPADCQPPRDADAGGQPMFEVFATEAQLAIGARGVERLRALVAARRSP